MKSSHPVADKILMAAQARMIRFGYHKEIGRASCRERV